MDIFQIGLITVVGLLRVLYKSLGATRGIAVWTLVLHGVLLLIVGRLPIEVGASHLL